MICGECSGEIGDVSHAVWLCDEHGYPLHIACAARRASRISQAQVAGCICPPGANLTCEAPWCPRKNHLTAARA